MLYVVKDYSNVHMFSASISLSIAFIEAKSSNDVFVDLKDTLTVP